MTSMLEKVSTKPRGGGGQLGAPELPQVDLLPPEVRAGRGLSRIKRWLAMSLVATLLVALLGYGWAYLGEQAAAEHLADAQQRSTEIAIEKKKYAEVPVVLKQIEDIQNARLFGMSTEVSWRPYFDAIAAVLPAGVAVDSFQVTQATPMSPAALPSEQLSEAGIGSILFTARSMTMPDGSAWLDAMEAVPGFVDPTLQSSMLTDEDGSIFYLVTMTVQIDPSALSLRFIPGGN